MKRHKSIQKRGIKNKRQPPVKIPLTFDKAMKGLLGLSPEDARDVRQKAAKPKK